MELNNILFTEKEISDAPKRKENKMKVTDNETGEVIYTTEDKMRSVMGYVRMLADSLDLSDETVRYMLPRLLKGESIDITDLPKFN